MGVDLDYLNIWFKEQLDIMKSELKAHNNELCNSIASLRQGSDNKDNIITALENITMERVDALRAELDVVSDKLKDAFSKIEELEQYSRRYSLRISGIGPFFDNDDYSAKVEVMGVEIHPSDIDPTNVENQLIVGHVGFTNYGARMRLYSARKILKRKNLRIYINEDLTVTRHALLKKLLNLRKLKKIDSVWTNDGRLFVWRNGAKT
jgi:hypothetical protein